MYSAETSTKLSSVYGTLGSSIGRTSELREITSWFAAGAAVLLLAALGLGRLWEGRLP
jgi:Trk-type K+ transport system membrane component